MSIHIGEIIKGLVKKKGISVTDFAEKINYSRRNIYEIFDKKTIDTGLLVKISKVLEQNLFVLYITDKEITEHQANKKGTNEELIQTVEQLKKIVNEFGINFEKVNTNKKSVEKKLRKLKRHD